MILGMIEYGVLGVVVRTGLSFLFEAAIVLTLFVFMVELLLFKEKRASATHVMRRGRGISL